MKKGFFLTFLALVYSLSPANAAEILGINFQQKGEISELEILLDSNQVEANKFNFSDNKQIILDLKNVSATEKRLRGFDTSEFSGAISFISAYKKPGTQNDIRVALQLRDNVRSVLKRTPNRIVLEIENRFGVFSQNDVNKGKKYEDKVTDNKARVGKLNIPRSASIEDILENLTLSGRKKYIGKKISFDIKSLPVADILKMIADASGFNMIMTDSVQKLAPLSLNLTNIPWDQALDTVLNLNKLVAKKNGVIMTVITLDEERKDQEQEASLQTIKTKHEPLVTKVFPISFAETKELSDILKPYLTDDRGNISIDSRTNSLIIKDSVEVMGKIIKIIELLDTQTPQVLIESKIVEVTEEYKREIGLEKGLQFGYDPIGSKASSNNITGNVSTSDNGGPGFTFGSGTGVGSSTLLGLSVSRFSRLLDLSFALKLMEFESKGKIIATPKVITQNKVKAKIETINTKFFDTSSTIDGETTVTFEQIDATLSLEVTPQVTNEGSISLQISLNKQHFLSSSASSNTIPDKFTRKLDTSVLVDNGSTIVLGGVYNFTSTDTHSGVPFLKDVPLIGWLFRTPENKSVSKEELIIFMTPRIINQKEAGIVENS